MEKEIIVISSRAVYPFEEKLNRADMSHNQQKLSLKSSVIKSTESLSNIMTEFMDLELKYHTTYTIAAIKLLTFKVNDIRKSWKSGQKGGQNSKVSQRDLNSKGRKGKYPPLDRESIPSSVDMIALIDDTGE